MSIKERITKKRVVAFLLSGIIPLAVIIFGIFVSIKGIVLTTSFLLSYIILPVGVIVGNLFLIFSQKKLSGKIIGCIFLAIVFVFLFAVINIYGLFGVIRCYKNDEVAEHCEKIAEASNLHPDLSELGQYESIEYYDYFSQQTGFFTCDADVLICCYGQSDYLEQKDLLDEKYVFQKEMVYAYKYACTPTVEIDGYVFRLLSVEGEYGKQLCYPQSLFFIATNDTTREIVYMSFYDDDIDCIISLDDFIKKDCGWKYIR